VNRLAWELRRRTVVAKVRQFGRRHYGLQERGSLDFAIRSEEHNRPRMAAAGISTARAPLRGMGLNTNAEYFAYLRSCRPLPKLGAAGYDLAAGLYEEAVGDTEDIEAYIAGLKERDAEGARRGVRLWFEAHIRTMRAEALAGLRRSQEAAEQLEQAEVCIRQVPGKPTHPYDFSPEIAPSARESIAEVWEMLDEPDCEAAVLEPVPTHEDLIARGERWREGWERMAEQGQTIEPQLLESVTPESVPYPDMHVIRYWAARMEAAVRRGEAAADPIKDMAATALRLLERNPLGDIGIAHRCRAVAYEVLGDRKRALDGWQRYILSLMAMYEPDRSPLYDRGWAQVERLGGRRWA